MRSINNVKMVRFWLLTTMLIIFQHLAFSFNLETELRKSLQGETYVKGTKGYEKRRLVKNGLCDKMFPDIIVVPKTTEDVAVIVKLAHKFKMPLSVRSGGHSYTCTSMKNGKF